MKDGEQALFVIIEQVPCGPPPYPLEHGFTGGAAYRVLGTYRPVDSRETWLLLSNDDNQLRYISQRHARIWSATSADKAPSSRRGAPDSTDPPDYFFRM